MKKKYISDSQASEKLKMNGIAMEWSDSLPWKEREHVYSDRQSNLIEKNLTCYCVQNFCWINQQNEFLCRKGKNCAAGESRSFPFRWNYFVLSVFKRFFGRNTVWGTKWSFSVENIDYSMIDKSGLVVIEFCEGQQRSNAALVFVQAASNFLKQMLC